jgi:predicted transcriptional regulator
MEIHLNSELQAKLDRMASDSGRDRNSLVQEAIERLVDYHEWFLREVEAGIAAAARGGFVEHEDALKLINSRYLGNED